MDQRIQKRPVAAYALTGLMLLFTVVFGGFFAVWCFTLRFLFSGAGWWGVVLLVLPGLIAWYAFSAARDAWAGLASAPPAAVGALALAIVLILLGQIEAWLRNAPRLGLVDWLFWCLKHVSMWAFVPIAILTALVLAISWLSPQFNRHVIESDLVYEDELPAPPDDDDHDELYLGGA